MPASHVKPDHFAMDVLAQGIERQDLSPALERPAELSHLRMSAEESAEAIEVEHPKTLTFAERPIVIEALEQIGCIAGEGILGAALDALFELKA